MSTEFCSEFERKPYTPFYTCKRCGQRRHDEPVICLKQSTQFEKSLKQRQEVWGYFKSGAPGIETDGPYVLDKRDVWYMRHSSEQHAGYAWQEKGKTFIPVDLCFICNTLADIELLTECEVCFAFVCIDCSCGCNEPGYSEVMDFNPTALQSKGADPRNDKAWVERECKKILDMAAQCAAPKSIVKDAEQKYIDACEKAMRDAFDRVLIESMFGTVNTACLTPEALHEAIEAFIDADVAGEHVPSLVLESDLVWDVKCLSCGKVYHIKQPDKGTVFAMDFTCDCGHPISLSFGGF